MTLAWFRFLDLVAIIIDYLSTSYIATGQIKCYLLAGCILSAQYMSCERTVHQHEIAHSSGCTVLPPARRCWVIHQNSDGSIAAVRRQYRGSTAAVLRQYRGSTAAVRRQYCGSIVTTLISDNFSMHCVIRSHKNFNNNTIDDN